MSKAEFWQRGEAIDYANATETKIEANEIVQLGSRIGVAGTDIAPGEVGSLLVFGVFEMPKDNAAITAGADVFYSNGKVSATGGEGAKAVGYAIQAADADATTAKVKLLG